MPRCRNFRASILSITAGAADTEFAVTHGLYNIETGAGIIPRGFIVCRKSSPASLYESGTPWTEKTAYLKSSAGGAVFYVIFFG